MRASELTGLKVVDAATGDRVGRVSSLLVDTDRLRVAALLVRPRAFGGELVLPFDQVQALGEHAVVARSAASLVRGAEWAPPSRLIRLNTLQGRDVVTAGGRRVGAVCDLFVDLTTGAVTQVEVESSVGSSATSWVHVTVDATARLGSDALVVAEPQQRESAAQPDRFLNAPAARGNDRRSGT